MRRGRGGNNNNRSHTSHSTSHKKVVTFAVVIIPDEHQWGPIQAIRKDYDKAFTRWMPHINLLYPFIDFRIPDTSDLIKKIELELSQIAPFDIHFSSISTFPNGRTNITYLEPNDLETGKVSSQLIYLQSRLESIFPFCDDLSSKSPKGFQPHLTLGQIPVGSERELNYLFKPCKDIRFTVKSIHLISRPPTFSDEPDQFTIGKSIPLTGEIISWDDTATTSEWTSEWGQVDEIDMWQLNEKVEIADDNSYNEEVNEISSENSKEDNISEINENSWENSVNNTQGNVNWDTEVDSGWGEVEELNDDHDDNHEDNEVFGFDRYLAKEHDIMEQHKDTYLTEFSTENSDRRNKDEDWEWSDQIQNLEITNTCELYSTVTVMDEHQRELLDSMISKAKSRRQRPKRNPLPIPKILRKCNMCNEIIFAFEPDRNDRHQKLRELFCIYKHKFDRHGDKSALNKLVDIVVEYAKCHSGRRAIKSFELVLDWVRKEDASNYSHYNVNEEEKKSKTRRHAQKPSSAEGSEVGGVRGVKNWEYYPKFATIMVTRLNGESRKKRHLKGMLDMLRRRQKNALNHKLDPEGILLD